METDLSTIDQEQVKSNGQFKKGQTLDQFMPTESWNKLVDLLALVIPEEQLKIFEPWFVTNFLINPLVIQNLNLPGSLDTELLAFAKKEALQIGYLEEINLQLGVLEAIHPVNFLVRSLMQGENIIQSSTEEILSLYECYASSDLNCLTEMTGTIDDGGTMDLWQHELLIRQRNRTWIPVIEKTLLKGQAFVAVGAAHLVGDHSVLQMLESEGYTIERVEF